MAEKRYSETAARQLKDKATFQRYADMGVLINFKSDYLLEPLEAHGEIIGFNDDKKYHREYSEWSDRIHNFRQAMNNSAVTPVTGCTSIVTVTEEDLGSDYHDGSVGETKEIREWLNRDYKLANDESGLIKKTTFFYPSPLEKDIVEEVLLEAIFPNKLYNEVFKEERESRKFDYLK